MPWIVRSIRWIMVISGVLTATMAYAVIATDTAIPSAFTLDGPLANIILRNWGALIALVGGMLIYGAVEPAVRPLVLVVAGVSKAMFIALVLSEGTRYLTVKVAIVVDLMMIVLFGWYLVSTRSLPRPRPRKLSADGDSLHSRETTRRCF